MASTAASAVAHAITIEPGGGAVAATPAPWWCPDDGRWTAIIARFIAATDAQPRSVPRTHSSQAQ
jgi:hypothetical protein